MNKPEKLISAHEALIYGMVTVAAADRSMTDRELAKIAQIISTVPVFAGYDRDNLGTAAEHCGALLEHEEGLDEILDIIADTLEPRLYETAYALAIEVAAADLHVEQEELRFLQMLRDRLEIDELVVAAIERSARVRYRKL